MAEAVLSTNMMDQTANGLNQDLMDRLERDDRLHTSESDDDDRSSGGYGKQQDASRGHNLTLDMTSRGLSVIHRRRNFQPPQGEPVHKAGGNAGGWLAGQDFGRVFSQTQMAQQSGSSKFWKTGQPGKPAHYARRTQLRVKKGSYWDRFMGAMNWLNNVLPVFNPHTPGRRAWDILVMTVVLYNAWSVPMEVSFGLPADPAIEAVSVAVDVIFGADILTNFRTAYVDKTGHLVKDTDRIALQYMKFWFWIDLFATIPYEEIVLAAAGNLSGDEVNALGFLRTPRLLRLGRIFRLLDRLKAANLVRVASLMGAMILLAHWLACIWYMLFKFTSFVGFEEWAISMEGDLDEDNNVSVYIASYYQSFLLLLGEDLPAFNNVERVYMICILLGGAVLYSAVVSQMAVLVASMDLVGMRHRLRQGTTLDVLSYIGLNKENRKRVEEYFNYITHYSHPAGEGIAFLNELPKPLFEEVTGYAYRKHLQRVPLFFDLEEAFLMNLSLRMRMIMFIPKETIFRAGDLGLEMYIICKGSVAVIGRHNHMLGLLTVGQHFGEIALFTEAKRTANCVSMSNLDLCVLSAFDFKAVLKDFPHSAKTLKEAAMAKLRQFQVAGTAGVEEEDMEAETRQMEERMQARARRSAEYSRGNKPLTIKEISMRRRQQQSMDKAQDGSTSGSRTEGPPSDDSSDDAASPMSSSRKRKGGRAVRRISGAAEGSGKVGLVGADSVQELAGGEQGPGNRKGGKGGSTGSSSDGEPPTGIMGMIERKASVGFVCDEEEDRPAPMKSAPLRRKSTLSGPEGTKSPIQRKSSALLGGDDGGGEGVGQVHKRSSWHAAPSGGEDDGLHQGANGIRKSNTQTSLMSGEPSGPLLQQQQEVLVNWGEGAEHVPQGPFCSLPRRKKGTHANFGVPGSMKSTRSPVSGKSPKSSQFALHRRLEIMRAGALETQTYEDMQFVPKPRTIQRPQSSAVSFQGTQSVDLDELYKDEEQRTTPDEPPPRVTPQERSSEALSARASPHQSSSRPRAPAPLTSSSPEPHSSHSFSTPTAHTAPGGVRGSGGQQPQSTPPAIPPATHNYETQGRARPDDDSAGPTPSQDTPSSDHRLTRANGWPIGEGHEHAASSLPASGPPATTTTTTTSRLASSSTRPRDVASTRQPPRLISESGSPPQQHLGSHAQRDHYQQQRQRNASPAVEEVEEVVPPPLPPFPPHPAPPPAPSSASAQLPPPLLDQQLQHQHHHPQQQLLNAYTSEATIHPSLSAGTPLSHSNPPPIVSRTSNPITPTLSPFAHNPPLPPHAPRSSSQVTPQEGTHTTSAAHSDMLNSSSKRESVRPGLNVSTKVPSGVSPRAAMFSLRGPKGSVMSPRGSSPRWRPEPIITEPGTAGEGAAPQWFRSILSKTGSRNLLASPRGNLPSAFGAISASVPWGASSTMSHARSSASRNSLQRYGSTDAQVGAGGGHALPKPYASFNLSSMQRRGSAEVLGNASGEPAALKPRGSGTRSSIQRWGSTDSRGGVGGESMTRPRVFSKRESWGGESTHLPRGSSQRSDVPRNSSTDARGPAAVAAAENAANMWHRESLLSRRHKTGSENVATDAAAGVVVPGHQGSKEGSPVRNSSTEAHSGKGGDADAHATTTQGPQAVAQGKEGAGLSVLRSHPFHQSSGRHIRRKSAMPGPANGPPSQSLSLRSSNLLQQEGSYISSKHNSSHNPTHSSNLQNYFSEGQECSTHGPSSRSSLPIPMGSHGRRGSMVAAAADIASKLFGGLGFQGAGQKEHQQPQEQQEHGADDQDQQHQHQQLQYEHNLSGSSAVACPKLMAKLRAAEHELEQRRDVDREVAALRAELEGMHKQAESDKPLQVMLYKQVKALLAAMEGLGSRVEGLDGRMATIQGQILRLEASSNMTSHGLLGKTLEDENMLPAPKLQLMRPKSDSRRQRAAQGSGSFPPKSSHDKTGSGKSSGQWSGSFQGQYGSLNMQYEAGRGQHGSGTYPEGIGKEHQEMGRTEPFGGHGSNPGVHGNGVHANCPVRPGSSASGQDGPGEGAIQRSGSRSNRPDSGPGLGMVGRSITRGNNNSKRQNDARAPTRSILKLPSAVPDKDQAIKAEEQSAAAVAAAARPIKRMTSKGGTSTGSGSFPKEGQP